MVFASGVTWYHEKKSFSKPKETKRRFSSSNDNEICDRLKLLLPKKQAGNISNIFKEENVAISDKLLDYKCVSFTQHRLILLESLN